MNPLEKKLALKIEDIRFNCKAARDNWPTEGSIRIAKYVLRLLAHTGTLESGHITKVDQGYLDALDDCISKEEIANE